jgi:FecR protein
MKKPFLLILLTLLAAFASAEEKHQSYISYDDGGTVVKSGDDGREIDAHRNLPVFPGDEIVTARRGRAEVRLSDGNILGIDRTTALRLRSVLDSYEGDANETVVELRYGKVAVHRTDLGRDHVRLDTDNASYVSDREGLYSVETDSKGRDRVTVFDGTLEVRTPTRATRLREGETVTLDETGLFDLTGDQRPSADDFERWFLARAERFGSYDSRYMDRRLGYWTDDLDAHGRWVMVSGIGWSWRPFVSAGWRPYYHGYWHHSRAGHLTWVSYDPWGWGPYHYGRWAFDPGYGWVWVPGFGYSPAWVYWMYGPSYVGWAPAGWWDCYRPYYGWAYNRSYSTRGFGWYGRARTYDLDLRPWTFVDSGVLISTRVDHAAMKTDMIKQRLSRDPNGYATVVGGNGRMTRHELRDPAEAIRRRGLDGRNTGAETGAPPVDVTPFVRRDPDVGGTIRDRIVRGRDSGGTTTVPATGPSRTVSGGLAPIGRGGSVAPVGGGNVAPIGGGNVAPSTGSTPDRNTGSWRGRVSERGATDRATDPSTTPTETPDRKSGRDTSWRTRIRNTEDTPTSNDRNANASGGTSDVSRRVIDRIGGARVVPKDSSTPSSGSSSRDRSSATRERSSGSRDSSRDRSATTRDRSSGSSGSRESARPSTPPPSSSPSNSGSSSRSSGSNDSGSSGHRSSGGKIERDQ